MEGIAALTGMPMPGSSYDSCSEGTAHDLEQRDVGADKNYGDVSVSRCRRCGRCWLRYLMEYEYLTAAGRWFEGEIAPDAADRLKAKHALKLFRNMESYYRGGSAFGGQVTLSQGPPERWLLPFPGK